MKITPIFHILSILIMPLSGFMMVSGFVDFVFNNQNWINFLISATSSQQRSSCVNKNPLHNRMLTILFLMYYQVLIPNISYLD